MHDAFELRETPCLTKIQQSVATKRRNGAPNVIPVCAELFVAPVGRSAPGRTRGQFPTIVVEGRVDFGVLETRHWTIACVAAPLRA